MQNVTRLSWPEGFRLTALSSAKGLTVDVDRTEKRKDMMSRQAFEIHCKRKRVTEGVIEGR